VLDQESPHFLDIALAAEEDLTLLRIEGAKTRIGVGSDTIFVFSP
jgi:hypothetical protein